jgi:hypothetical protein
VKSGLGQRLKKECDAWAQTFALDPPIIESAVQGYLQMLERAETAATESDVVHGLAKLRKEVSKMISSDERARGSAEHIDGLVSRLNRTIERTTVLEDAGLATDLSELRTRLEAARSMLNAIRAAIARRGKR